VAGDHDLRRPTAGLEAQKAELDRQERRVPLRLGDVRVHAAYECTDDGLAARVIERKLLVHVAAELVQPCADVPLQLARPEDLGGRACRLPAPQFELEKPIPRGAVALREEQVLLRSRVDVGDSPPVPEDLDRLREALDA
jgi:hypothetical protein